MRAQGRSPGSLAPAASTAREKDNPQMGWPDIVGEMFFAFFTWSLTGLVKSALDYPEIRQDRWAIFRVSLAGVAVLVLTTVSLCCALTAGEGRYLAFVEEYSWYIFAASAGTYCVLVVFRLVLCIPDPKSG